MFGLWQHKKPEIYQHWYVLLGEFTSEIQLFYAQVEQDLTERLVPGLEFSRIEFSEGGMLTPNREYLRARRELLVFEICSAPFGTSWYFSCRFGEIPFRLRIWEVLVLLALAGAVFLYYAAVFGLFCGAILLGMSVVSVLMLINMAATSSRRDLDRVLLRIPVLGSLYELFMRRNSTYVREDNSLAYMQIVDAVVRARVLEAAKQHGIENVEFLNNPDPLSHRTLIDRIKDRVKQAMQAGLAATATLAKTPR